jgi:chromosome segregation ATPase
MSTAAKDIEKTIRDAYQARMKARQSLDSLQLAREQVESSKADAWAADVVSRGVDPNTIVATHEGIERELNTCQKRIDAVRSLLALLEGRIGRLKHANVAEVAQVLRQEIAAIQAQKTSDEKDVQAANQSVENLWKEVRELERR